MFSSTDERCSNVNAPEARLSTGRDPMSPQARSAHADAIVAMARGPVPPSDDRTEETD